MDQFSKQPLLDLQSCHILRGKVTIGPVQGMPPEEVSVGRISFDTFLYWGRSVTRYHIRYRKAEKWLNRFHILGGLFFATGFLTLSIWLASTHSVMDDIVTSKFWTSQNTIAFLFWVSMVFFSYVIYRTIVLRVTPEVVDIKKSKTSKDISEALVYPMEKKTLSSSQTKDISATFTEEAHKAIEEAYQIADRHGDRVVNTFHLFYALLGTDQAVSVLLRLGISPKHVQAEFAKLFSSQVSDTIAPMLSKEVLGILFYAYENAKVVRQEYVHVTELLLATVNQSEQIQEFLYDANVDKNKLANVIEWMRVRERSRRRYIAFRKIAAHRSKHGMDRAMTAVATPFLNSFSQDITLSAKMGYLAPCVARDKEIEEIFRIVDGGAQSIVLVGESGVGKMSIVEGIANRMVEEDVPERLKDKRLVQLSVSSLLAGTTVSGAQERLIHMMNEIGKARNIILFINNIHELMGGDGKGAGLDVSGTLAEYLRDGRFLTVATTTTDGFNRHILQSELGSSLAKVMINEMDENQAIQVLESKVGGLEYKHGIFFSYDAIATTVRLSKQFLHDQRIPENAIGLMTEAASFVRNKKGEHQLVMSDDIGILISEKTGIPVTNLSQDESTKLLHLEEEMHMRVVGQHDAVVLVANALRRARADMRSKGRPIANFLFLGPTGVGKTELAKTIAEVYFGGEQRMIRLDMSEFQDRSGIYRLIGQPGQQGTGMLTEAVRQNPFALVLLDELEKADKDILNLFLQVFDDGRLTDSTGRVIDFTNTIIIATSNAGTEYASRELASGKPLEDVRQALIRDELKQYYRPEFINRFDSVVLFKPLNREEIKHISELMLKRVAKDLETRGVFLRIDPNALESLADIGFDPQFGARPMRRAIQEHVENKLAELILSNSLQRRDTVVIGGGMSIEVEHGA